MNGIAKTSNNSTNFIPVKLWLLLNSVPILRIRRKSSQRDKLYLKANARVFLAETQKVLRLHKSVAILVARLEDSFQMHQNILHVHF